MLDGYEPLIAYLRALRGSVGKSSGELDKARVLEFGFPDLLPGDDPRSESAARADMLLRRLHTCIDAIAKTHTGDGAILRHYFFGTGNQNERQIAAVKEAGLSDSTPRNDRAKALLRLASELHATAGAAATSTVKPDENRVDLVKDLVAILERIYRGSHLDDLARIVIADAPPIYDASVTLKLRDDRSDSSAYHLTLSTMTACTHEVHFMALSPRATLSDLIFSTCPQVAEVFTCSDRAHLNERADAWTSDPNTLTLLGTDVHGRATRHPMQLQRVEPEEHSAVLSELPHKLHGDIVLLKANLPRSPSDPPTHLELHLPSLMSRNDGYCYWLADRPTFLKTITFDASALTLREGESFTLQPCLRATAYEPEPHDNVFTIGIDSWVVRGQGALLHWG